MGELVRHSGNYKELLSYQKADAIFQLTYFFCHKYLAKGDRTIDQMVQAARSGKQNIIEGCAASATSAATEIKLVNVAKASLKELLEDFEDYLKTHNMRQGNAEVPNMKRCAGSDALTTMQNISCNLPKQDPTIRSPI